MHVALREWERYAILRHGGCIGHCSMLAFALSVALAAEPGLDETQAAAARTAAGLAADDESRVARARRAHWAPVLRGQLAGKDSVKSRRGQVRLAPLVEDDTSDEKDWGVALQWDFAQIIYARDETQVALANAHLARLRRDASEAAAKLWIERRKRSAAWSVAPPGPARDALALLLLETTASLDALTGGLFHDVLLREQAEFLPPLEKK